MTEQKAIVHTAFKLAHICMNRINDMKMELDEWDEYRKLEKLVYDCMSVVIMYQGNEIAEEQIKEMEK